MTSPAKYYHSDVKKFLNEITKKESNYIILDNSLAFEEDIQKYLNKISKNVKDTTRIVVISFNFLWKPILNLAAYLKLREKDIREPNWLTKTDMKNIFYLEGFEEIKSGSRFILPLDLGILSEFINIFLAQLPIINKFCLTNYQIFRKLPKIKDYSVSIIIPARNEEGNIKGILKKIPKIGTKTEVIFVEGWSKDDTYKMIQKEIEKDKPKWLSTYLYKQKGKGKKDAVSLGFSKASNELLMILDADLTVPASDLNKFYQSISSGKAEIANGIRLVYPIEKEAMQTLNYIGNKIFSVIFTYLLGQPIKDTLCGTKALLKTNYLKIRKINKNLGNFDPFGDFDLLFGASRLNLRIIDIPVRYRERKYGRTNISRFKNGVELAKMTYLAARKIKFI